MLITDLFDPDELAAALADGWVRAQQHPALPYTILNYAEKAVFAREWNDITRQCRGLIYNHNTERIVARPFRKFFNHGEPGAHVGDLNEPVRVTDKMDGSLGILYPVGSGKYAVATRGSFTSDQAVHATKVWEERYAGRFRPSEHYTYLFEIVYPSNRIVVDYGPLDDLVLIGLVGVEDGVDGPIGVVNWPGPATEVFPYFSFGEALAAEPRPGKEGLVIQFGNGERVKLKQEDYVLLHRIVTGLNARTVWERIGEGADAEAICADLPDEFHGFVTEVAGELTRQAGEITARAEHVYADVVADLPAGWTRKDFALAAAKLPERAYLFRLLDGKPVGEMAWKQVKPSHEWNPAGRTFSEATA